MKLNRWLLGAVAAITIAGATATGALAASAAPAGPWAKPVIANITTTDTSITMTMESEPGAAFHYMLMSQGLQFVSTAKGPNDGANEPGDGDTYSDTITWTGLTAGTLYRIAVRAELGGRDPSPWILWRGVLIPAATGPQGAPGLSQVQAEEPYGDDVDSAPGLVQSPSDVIAPDATTTIFAECPSGLVALGGGYRADAAPDAYESYATPSTDTPAGMQVIASEPSYVNADGQLEGASQAPTVGSPTIGNYLPNAWAIAVYNSTSTAQRARVAVICAAESS